MHTCDLFISAFYKLTQVPECGPFNKWWCLVATKKAPKHWRFQREGVFIRTYTHTRDNNITSWFTLSAPRPAFFPVSLTSTGVICLFWEGGMCRECEWSRDLLRNTHVHTDVSVFLSLWGYLHLFCINGDKCSITGRLNLLALYSSFNSLCFIIAACKIYMFYNHKTKYIFFHTGDIRSLQRAKYYLFICLSAHREKGNQMYILSTVLCITSGDALITNLLLLKTKTEVKQV